MSLALPQHCVLGLGEKSTQYYLERIHQKFNEINGGSSTCPLLLYQVDFQEINPFLPNKFKTLLPKLEIYLSQMQNLGIGKLLVPNITLHEALDKLDPEIKICHPVNLTVNYLQEQKVSEVIIFGTGYTMNSAYLKRKFKKEKIKIIPPSLEDQEIIDVFRKLVYNGKTTRQEIKKFESLIKKYTKNQLVVLACTELSVFAPKENTSIVDMAELQINDFLR